MGSSPVNTIFEIALNSDVAENPSFRARSACGGPFSTQFHANNPNDLERKWLAQTNKLDVALEREREEGRRARGLQFLGFDNVNLVQHFIDITPELISHQKAEIYTGIRRQLQGRDLRAVAHGS